ncbi:MAG: hypothetical protein PF545_02005, partial [Elusimicrobia bacterium]|nr:hypothetical protein [Elusimicrobiota bacterium]
MKINLIKKSVAQSNIFYWMLITIAAGSLLQFLFFPKVHLDTDRLTYLHYDIVKLKLKVPGKYKGMSDTINVKIFKDSNIVTGVCGENEVKLKLSENEKYLEGVFPVPWAAEDGLYTAKVYKGDRQLGWESSFVITSRLPQIDIKEPLKVLDLESTKRLHKFKVKTPEGSLEDYKGIFKWINYIGGNTLWYMAGQTAAYREDYLSREMPWVEENLKTLTEFAKASSENEIKFGAWVSCFMAFGKSSLKPDWYRYSYQYDRGSKTIVQTDGISIADPGRINDIIKLVKRLNDEDNIDYIGLDYIRPAGGGLELVDDFINAMDVEVPQGWGDYTRKEKMLWLGRIVTRPKNRDVPVINKWNWWRAHRMSKIIRQIKEEVKLKKPLWVFLLSWELGHQHGQDPVMFQDAGADLIAVMMYQSDAAQFNYTINEWKKYVRGRTVNIVPGNQFDWPLHQYSVLPSGPEEFQRRLIKSVDYLTPTGNLKGLFIHDFSRALWGRKGPYSTKEWFMAAAAGFNRIDPGDKDITLSLILPSSAESEGEVEGTVRIKNRGDHKISGPLFSLHAAEELGLSFDQKEIDIIKPGEDYKILFKTRVKGVSGRHLGRYM